MRGVFISYRRDDASGHAGRLYDRLSARLGKDRVFRDVDTIEPGENFADVLRKRVESAGVVLVLIGRHWLNANDAAGKRRLDDPGDFVRLESEIALLKKVPLIPVLVEGTRMPRPEDLPESIRGLAFANAVGLDEDTFDYEVEKLAGKIETILGSPPTPPWTRRWIWSAAAAAIVAVGAAVLTWKSTGGKPVPPQIATARTMAQAQDYSGAWDLLTAQLKAEPDARLEAAREDLAMQWVRGMGARDTQRDPVLPAVVDLVAPVLTHGAEQATGSRKADLLAHYGWSLYLRRRLGNDVDAAAPYRQALQIDPANPFANVMLGHWTLLRNREGGLSQARQYFQKAVAAGRERAVVRGIQLAGIENVWADPTDAEYLRVVSGMVKSGEPLPDRAVYKAQSVYYFSVGDKLRRDSVMDAVPVEDHVAMVRKLRELVDTDKRRSLDIWIGRLEEKAGRPQQALEAYQRLEVTPNMIDSWREEIIAARKRLTKFSSSEVR